MLLIILMLGVSGLMFYIFFKPIRSPEIPPQKAYTLDIESNGFIPKVSYSEAKQNA